MQQATPTQPTFVERRAAYRADVAARKTHEELHRRAQRAAEQAASQHFRAIGHGVVDADARETALSVAREAGAEAVKTFKPEAGTSLEQWTVRLAKHALARAADATFGQFTLPRERAAQVRVLRSTEARLYSELGRRPTDAEVVEAAVGFTPLILARVRDADRLLRTSELDAPVNDVDGVGTTRGSLIAGPATRTVGDDIAAETARADLISMTAPLLDQATRGGRIFAAVNGLGCNPMSLELLAVEFGISRQRVRQILDQTVAKLRALEGIDELREVLEAAIE